MESLNVRKIIEQVERGQIRIPAFQRGFVWEPDRVAFLIDSIYKSYPYGALLFWRTNATLKFERQLGPFQLPDPSSDYPIDYVLDGQQRVTSIYATFQTDRDWDRNEEWKDIYFDFTIEDAAQEPQFFALMPTEVDTTKHFPLRTLFDTTGYRRATQDLTEEIAKRIDSMQSVFKEASIPVQIFRTDERGTVAVIFERINRQGVPLDTMQLLSAWTWSEDFQLQDKFEELAEELEDFNYSNGLVDENLLLRCASAVLVGDPKPEAIIDITGQDIRNRFDEVANGVRGALDFVRSNFGVQRIDNLPFQTILVPLSAYFAVSGNQHIVVSDAQRAQLVRWFWRTCFSRRYSSGVLRSLKDDITSMLDLREGRVSNLGNFAADVPREYFLTNSFRVSNVNTKTFVLLLSSRSPLSFVSGTEVDLARKLREYNNTEFHHTMPKKHVVRLGTTRYSVNALANFSFVSRAENRLLGGDAPSVYRSKMPGNIDTILERALCPHSLFNDDYDTFVSERADLLCAVARNLIE
jgi:hypothetical protein